jgi:hypothetical protein
MMLLQTDVTAMVEMEQELQALTEMQLGMLEQVGCMCRRGGWSRQVACAWRGGWSRQVACAGRGGWSR